MATKGRKTAPRRAPEPPSLHEALEALPISEEQRRELERAIDDNRLALVDTVERRHEQRTARPPLLDLLDQARPYAERLLFREGLLPELAESGSDCVDGFLEVRGQWCDHIVHEAYQVIGNLDDGAKAFKAAYDISDASYVLGIAVGLQLRGAR